jgi:hypothetical protein
MCPKTPDPIPLTRKGSTLSRVTCPPRAIGRKDKERLSCNGMQQGSRVFKTHMHVIEAPARRVGRHHYHDLQTMKTGMIAPRYSASSHN